MATPVPVDHLPIAVGRFLKHAGVVGSGGEAKRLLEDGRVEVNGGLERRRGRRLQAGDEVCVDGAMRLRVLAARGRP